jgi:hypothetical protein
VQLPSAQQASPIAPHAGPVSALVSIGALSATLVSIGAIVSGTDESGTVESPGGTLVSIEPSPTAVSDAASGSASGRVVDSPQATTRTKRTSEKA